MWMLRNLKVETWSIFCATKMNVKEWSGTFCSGRVDEQVFGLEVGKPGEEVEPEREVTWVRSEM
jgi:hypothetical protein